MKNSGRMIITLKSDICVGSGYSYAGLIDSDICFDRYGLPYIPGRRIKGCMRQSAEDCLLCSGILSNQDIDLIFGTGGDDAVKGISIGNAYLEKHSEIVKELSCLSQNSVVTQESILNCFCHVQGQTKLDNGVAVDNSLRYTRVLNHYYPFDGREMAFVAEISLGNLSREDEGKLTAIAKATRNIGLKRNRGMGNISIAIEWDDIDETKSQNGEISGGEEERVIEFRITNTSPLMLSSVNDGESDKYIPGQAILGYLAGAYLRSRHESSEAASEDSVFVDLFLNGCTKYMNLVPCQGERLYYPAPAYIRKLKKTRKFVNVLNPDNLRQEHYSIEYDPGNGNQPKKLKGQFVWMDTDGTVDNAEVKSRVVYHHSHRGESRDGEEGILYSMECIEAGQKFAGKIYTKERYVALLEELLTSGTIRLGKSKSAQYGDCKLISCTVSTNEGTEESHDNDIVVTLLSDAVFLNESGEYTVYENEVYDLIAKQLGIEDRIDCSVRNQYSSIISTKIVVGYQSTWNLRRMPVPAICAGSCFVYRVKEKINIPTCFVGVRNHEGYGLIRIDEVDGMKYEVENKPCTNEANCLTNTCVLTKSILSKILIDSLMDGIKLRGIEKNSLASISASALGRITLMLKESLSYQRTPEEAKENFKARIESIKTDATRAEGLRIFYEVTKLPYETTQLSCDEKELIAVLGISDEEVEKCLKKRWGEYAMTLLTLKKYEKAVAKGGR